MLTEDELRELSPEKWREYEGRCWLSAIVDCGLLPQNLDEDELLWVQSLTDTRKKAMESALDIYERSRNARASETSAQDSQAASNPADDT